MDPLPLIWLAGAYGAILLFAACGYVLTGVFFSRILRRAGHPGWPAWVPLYQQWRMLELGEQAGWIALLSLVPGAGIVTTVFLIIAAHRIGGDFGRGGGFTVLFVFLPLVWMAYLAYLPGAWRASERGGAVVGPGYRFAPIS